MVQPLCETEDPQIKNRTTVRCSNSTPGNISKGNNPTSISVIVTLSKIRSWVWESINRWWVKKLYIHMWICLMAQLVKNLPAMQEIWVWSLGWEDIVEKGKVNYSSILVWRLIIFFAVKDGGALHSQQKQDWELTVAHIMNSLQNLDLNWRN